MMANPTFRSSRADPWSSPRSYTDPSMRLQKHGRIRTDEELTGRASYRRCAFVVVGACVLGWGVIAGIAALWSS